ncbi:MAG: crotonase/enoyl-CoA hydratase family protein [Acetobacteraceae bacterium]
MDYEHIRYDVADRILTITLNRPAKLNAVTDRTISELLDALDRADRDDDVRVIVFTGAGRAYCAGADLSERAEAMRDGSAEAADDPGIDGHRDGGGLVTLRLFDCLKPTIAACNGAAVGFGVTMQLAMDMRLASDTARYGFVFTRRAIVMEAASSWFLPRLVGPQQALEWVMTGRIFDAQEALRGGLVRSVHAPEDLLPAAYALAREIADNTAPVAVALNRQLMWKMLGADHPMAAHRLDSKGIYARRLSDDAKEGVLSFMEKRKPDFPMKVSDGMPSFFPWWESPGFR